MEGGGKPVGRAVVVLVEQIDGQGAVPPGVVVAPRHHVANDFHLGIAGKDGLAELLIALVVVVALLTGVGLVVLVAYLKIFQVEGLGVPVPGAQGAVFRCDGAVGILQGVQALVNPRLEAVAGRHAAMPYSHIDHIEGFCAQVLGQL